MAKQKLFDDIKQNPTRIYRSPGDVLRDRRFGDAERCGNPARLAGIRLSDTNDQGEIGAMIVELEGRLYTASNHAAE